MNDDDVPAALRLAVGDPPPAPDPLAGLRHAARRRARRRAVLAPAGVVVLVLALVAGAAVLRPSPARAPVAEPGPSSEQAAQARADALVGEVVLPDGARETDGPGSPRLSEPGTTVGTDYQVRATRFWTLPMPFAALLDDLKARQQGGRSVSSTGTATDRSGPTSAFVEYGELQISLAPLDDATTAVRADAQVLWTPERSASERVPGRVRTAEVTAGSGLPAQTTRSVVVRGAQAQHLADLVDGLVRDTRGVHGCPMDSGRRRRIEFTTTRGTAVAEGFSCGSVTLTLDGVPQPPLLDAPDLDAAVEAALG